MEWISIKDRLPRPPETVMAADIFFAAANMQRNLPRGMSLCYEDFRLWWEEEKDILIKMSEVK